MLSKLGKENTFLDSDVPKKPATELGVALLIVFVFSAQASAESRIETLVVPGEEIKQFTGHLQTVYSWRIEVTWPARA